MRVYISGPITGRKMDEYMRHFAAAELKLKCRGHSVVNPALVNSNLPKDFNHDDYMVVSLTELMTCDAICILKGWHRSKGSREEIEQALRRRMPILYEEDL